jgi:hypothetical protein
MIQIRKLFPDEIPASEEPPAQRSKGQNGRGELGFEATLRLAADKLRGNLDAAEYKHVVLGLIFLKYISDAFEERRTVLLAEPGADPEDRDEYLAENVFWVCERRRKNGTDVGIKVGQKVGVVTAYRGPAEESWEKGVTTHGTQYRPLATQTREEPAPDRERAGPQ